MFLLFDEQIRFSVLVGLRTGFAPAVMYASAPMLVLPFALKATEARPYVALYVVVRVLFCRGNQAWVTDGTDAEFNTCF